MDHEWNGYCRSYQFYLHYNSFLTRGLEITNAAIARGIDIAGFFHWTGVDNYEWNHGYDVKFGIIEKDRTVKPSAQVLAAEALG